MFFESCIILNITCIFILENYIKSLHSKTYNGLYKKHQDLHKRKDFLLKSVQRDIKVYISLYKKLKSYFVSFTHNTLVFPMFIYIYDFIISDGSYYLKTLYILMNFYYSYQIYKFNLSITGLTRG